MVTMLPKLVVLLSSLYVVKAGVLTVNAFEGEYDGVESVYDGADTLDRSVRNCLNSECNNICRALGFAHGECITATMCRCSGRLASVASIEEVNQEIDQDPEEVVVRTTHSCGAAECNGFCRKLGYARGVCIGSYCQCRSRAAKNVFQPEIENPSYDTRSVFLDAIRPGMEIGLDGAETIVRSVRNCVNSQCNSICRSLGFAGGFCVSSNECRCSGRRVNSMEKAGTSDDVYQEIASVNDDAESVDRSVRNCENLQCNSICRSLGFAGGVCISSSVCRCSGRRVISMKKTGTDDIYREIASVNDDADTVDRSVRNCVNSECNSICHALGFAGGVCVSSSVCRCSGRRVNSMEKTEIASVNDDAESVDRSVRNCENLQCNSICRSLGFAGGVCISSTVCRCSGSRVISMKKTGTDDIYREIASVNDDADTVDRSVRNCVNSECNSICRALGFAGGVCVGSSVCRCSGRRVNSMEKTEIASDNDDADSVDRSVRNCVNSECNSICRALGFAGGVCVSSSVCRCSGRRVNSMEKTDTSDDIYQEIASVNDDADSVDRPVRNCVNSQCNSICHALGFAGGVCVSSTMCRCSGRLAKSMEDSEDGTVDDVYQEIAQINDDADTVDRSVRNCINSQCNSICRDSGFAQGVCISPTICRCSGHRLASDAHLEANTIQDKTSKIARVNDDADSVDRSVRNCVNSECNNICRSLGFARGQCMSPTVCRCSGRLVSDASLEPNTIENKTPELSKVADKKENCKLRWCEQTCHRMVFSGGACVNGRCKCDSMLSSPTTDSDIAGTTNEIYPETVKPTVEEESNDIPKNLLLMLII